MKELAETLPPRDSYQASADNLWLEIGIIVGVAVLIVVGGIVWAKYFRNQPRRRHAHSNTIMGAPAGSSGKKRGRGERYSRRNPTLAETGGLPPIREDLDATARSSPGQLPS